MEHAGQERIQGNDGKESRKKPYISPRLTVHGDVEAITKVLRLAGAKGQTISEPSG